VHKLDGDLLHDRRISRVSTKDLVESGVGRWRPVPSRRGENGEWLSVELRDVYMNPDGYQNPSKGTFRIPSVEPGSKLHI
jgi:hypothetical protein